MHFWLGLTLDFNQQGCQWCNWICIMFPSFLRQWHSNSWFKAFSPMFSKRNVFLGTYDLFKFCLCTHLVEYVWLSMCIIDEFQIHSLLYIVDLLLHLTVLLSMKQTNVFTKEQGQSWLMKMMSKVPEQNLVSLACLFWIYFFVWCINLFKPGMWNRLFRQPLPLTHLSLLLLLTKNK